MTEQEFYTELKVGENLFQNGGDAMLAALAFERCRQYVGDLERDAKETGVANPKIKELEILLPRGYQRIPHV